MIEWVLIIDMAYTSQKINMDNYNSCISAMNTIYKANESSFRSDDELQNLTDGAICINVKTGEIRRKGE